ncbi:hypothetical protein NDU88_004491 [Pleurodeles waltl]|uniref:Uncharacterized protein n=1 Tax=Pleurodeles waltl TaxID=8319 RepID=A0AAV7VKG8_PLEWA|nr:hypothetical protein NDU88_004491 [Pleurodeles waltl]
MTLLLPASLLTGRQRLHLSSGLHRRKSSPAAVLLSPFLQRPSPLKRAPCQFITVRSWRAEVPQQLPSQAHTPSSRPATGPPPRPEVAERPPAQPTEPQSAPPAPRAQERRPSDRPCKSPGQPPAQGPDNRHQPQARRAPSRPQKAATHAGRPPHQNSGPICPKSPGATGPWEKRGPREPRSDTTTNLAPRRKLSPPPAGVGASASDDALNASPPSPGKKDSVGVSLPALPNTGQGLLLQ